MSRMNQSAFHVTRRRYRDAAEYTRAREIRIDGFTEWYVGPRRTPHDWFDRHALNAKARLYPDYLLEVRTDEGRAVAYVATTPGYWSGAPEALHDLHHYDQTLSTSPLKNLLLTCAYWATAEVLHLPRLFDAAFARQRSRKVSGANAIVLIAIAVDPDYRGHRIPSLLITEVQTTAARLGYAQVVAPFRPNAYGAFKAERRAGHDPALFDEYCALRDDAGLPRDPWLRVVARHGARFVRTEPRSYSVIRPLGTFDAFRARHKPESWYSPAPDVWECGETPTWYVDRCRKIVRSVEPNIWGVLPVGP
jgi:GNAT superfamily N-acetyltransferase